MRSDSSRARGHYFRGLPWILMLSLALLGTYLGVNWTQGRLGKEEDKVTGIEASQLKEMLSGDSPPLLVDVRQPAEFEAGHIPGAILVPLGQLESIKERVEITEPVVVYCRSGSRSLTAAQLLISWGYREVMNLEGGILAWPYRQITGRAPRPLEEEARSVLKILELAIAREAQALAIYRQLERVAPSSTVRETAGRLAQAEKAHRDRLYGEYRHMLEGKGETARPLSDLDLSGGPTDLPDPPSEPSQLLELAIAWEYRAYEFYRSSSRTVRDPEVFGLLDRLALEERSHAQEMEDLLARVLSL